MFIIPSLAVGCERTSGAVESEGGRSCRWVGCRWTMTGSEGGKVESFCKYGAES